MIGDDRGPRQKLKDELFEGEWELEPRNTPATAKLTEREKQLLEHLKKNSTWNQQNLIGLCVAYAMESEDFIDFIQFQRFKRAFPLDESISTKDF